MDVRPEAVKSVLAYTLQRRGTDDVDLDMPARLTPAVPVEDTLDAIAAMVQAGQPQGVAQLPVGQQAGIGRDAAGLDLQHQATTEIDPQDFCLADRSKSQYKLRRRTIRFG